MRPYSPPPLLAHTYAHSGHRRAAAPSPPTYSFSSPVGFFYIFTIITEATRSISTLIMTPKKLPSLFRGTFIYTNFAYVAGHVGMTRCRPVSRAM